MSRGAHLALKAREREEALTEIKRQIAAGELRVRQATAQERAEWAAEGRGPGHADTVAVAVARKPAKPSPRRSKPAKPRSASTTPAERAAALVRRVARYVEDHNGATQAEVRRQIGGRAESISIALERLIQEGYVERRREGRGYHHHTLKAFDRKGGSDVRA